MAGARVYSTDDARRLARRRLPKLVFDYIDGAAGDESGAGRNRSDLSAVQLMPRALRANPKRSLVTKFLGREFRLPFGVAPMGLCNLARPGADQMISEVTGEFNAPHCLSAAASSTLEDVHGWAGDRAWFQLYISANVDQSLAMVERARQANYDVLVFTVDVPEVARRRRDMRNGFKVPFRIGPRQFVDFALKPAWSLPMLFNGPPSPRNFEVEGGAFDRLATRAWPDWDFLDLLREKWPGKLIVKGVLNPEDALRVQKSGADAVWVSNHGGRQLESAPSTISMLPIIREQVGPDFPLIVDSGLRSGEDIARVLASGADFAMMGRPMLYAVAGAGKQGLREYFELISSELDVVMAQLGVEDIEGLQKEVVVR